MSAAVAAGPRSDLVVRTVAGALLMALALTAVTLDGVSFWALVTAASLLIMREFCALTGIAGWPRLGGLILLAGVLSFAQPQLDVDYPQVFGVYAAAVLVAAVLGWRVALGLLYAGLAGLALLYIRDQYDGFNLTLWVFATVLPTDIGPYFAAALARLASHTLVGEVRSLGLIGAVEIVAEPGTNRRFGAGGVAGPIVRDLCIARGLMVRAIRDSIVMCPPFVITREEVDRMVAIIAAALDEARETLAAMHAPPPAEALEGAEPGL